MRSFAPYLLDGDPLRDYAPITFLDRFVYKNPKAKANVEAKTFLDKQGIGWSDPSAIPPPTAQRTP